MTPYIARIIKLIKYYKVLCRCAVFSSWRDAPTFSFIHTFRHFALFCFRLTWNSKYDRKFSQIGGLTFIASNATNSEKSRTATASARFRLKGQQRSFPFFKKSRLLCNRKALIHHIIAERNILRNDD